MPRQSPYVIELSKVERGELAARARRYTSPYPIKMSESPSDVKRSPLLGEHTDEVLEELGYGADQIAALRTEKVI